VRPAIMCSKQQLPSEGRCAVERSRPAAEQPNAPAARGCVGAYSVSNVRASENNPMKHSEGSHHGRRGRQPRAAAAPLAVCRCRCRAAARGLGRHAARAAAAGAAARAAAAPAAVRRGHGVGAAVGARRRLRAAVVKRRKELHDARIGSLTCSDTRAGATSGRQTKRKEQLKWKSAARHERL